MRDGPSDEEEDEADAANQGVTVAVKPPPSFCAVCFLLTPPRKKPISPVVLPPLAAAVYYSPLLPFSGCCLTFSCDVIKYCTTHFLFLSLFSSSSVPEGKGGRGNMTAADMVVTAPGAAYMPPPPSLPPSLSLSSVAFFTSWRPPLPLPLLGCIIEFGVRRRRRRLAKMVGGTTTREEESRD